MILSADNEGPDPTARIRRLIWAFAVAYARRHILFILLFLLLLLLLLLLFFFFLHGAVQLKCMTGMHMYVAERVVVADGV